MGNVSPRIWSDILLALRSECPELARPWFNALEPTDLQFGVMRVRTPTETQRQYLRQQCQVAFNQAAQTTLNRLVTVEFVAPPEAIMTDRPLSFEEEGDKPILNPDYTFDNFVIGPNNRLAHAASVAVGDAPGRVYNPLFLHGSVGLGKTHLLQAVCHRLVANGNGHGPRILYLTCETFTNHFVEAIERGALHQFRYRYRHVDALVIDDIQFLGARERSREEFFHTFNTLYQSQKQIILSADEAPNGINGLEDRLVSRFSWGLVVRIDPPCLETRMAILHKKATLRCAELPEDVIHFIAATVESNTRELEGALTKVLATSQQYGGLVNLDIAKKALGDHLPAARRLVGITDILEVVTQHFNVRPADLQGKRRNRSLAFPRQICMYLARELTAMSLEEIGGYFGGRDHTTVLHATRTIAEQRTQQADLHQSLLQLTEALHHRIP
ncbi:MAG TPA: chromosomal replication initiator protein DnaA [Phycisphaerae bacterium]|nr:chromosomal replication initiator protein DnaA [Phycisphaerae bacterium]HRY67555.1 chromosomal replication initiator protein DnaA [Phycisphaerae bacterium]HSA24942.1 chromosomal replication initiator protein DnaA [Phycisphaerae bacterium]